MLDVLFSFYFVLFFFLFLFILSVFVTNKVVYIRLLLQEAVKLLSGFSDHFNEGHPSLPSPCVQDQYTAEYNRLDGKNVSEMTSSLSSEM